jgi:hypothetical protein
MFRIIMNYPRFNVVVLPLITLFAFATSAHAAIPQGFWCGTPDRELEVKVSFPAITSPGMTSQASFVLINGTDETAADPTSALIAQQNAAQVMLTDANITYQAAHVVGFSNGQNFVGPLNVSQISGFEVQINFNPSVEMTPAHSLAGMLTVVQMDGTQSQAALTCVAVE